MATIRAHPMAVLVGMLEASPRPEYRRAASSIAPDLRRAIEDAGRLGFVPAAVVVGIDDHLLATLGRAGATELWQTYAADMARAPLFAPIVAAVSNVFGTTPVTMMTKAASKAWQLSAKDTGRLVVEDIGSGGLTLVYADIVPVCRTEGYAVAALALPHAVLAVSGVSGVVRSDEGALAAGRLPMRVEWGGAASSRDRR